jgi:hypothetical protein
MKYLFLYCEWRLGKLARLWRKRKGKGREGKRERRSFSIINEPLWIFIFCISKSRTFVFSSFVKEGHFRFLA